MAYTELDRDAMREQLGTDYYQFGYHSMNNVFVQPAALIRGLADTLPDNVWLMENNPVDSVDGGGPTSCARATASSAPTM